MIFQVEMDSAVTDASPHIANIGRMVEVLSRSIYIYIKIYI